MTQMLDAQVWPAVAEHVALRPIVRRVHRAIGLGESALATAVTPILTDARARSPGLAAMVVHYRANQPQVLLILEGAADERGHAASAAELASLDTAIAAAIGPAYVGEGEDDLPTRVVASLAAEGVRLGAAESCTGGQISALITAVPGASTVFDGAVVSYDNRVKQALLGVPAALLAEHGAVSEAVARAMAEGAQRALGCPITVATTGIAGPGGGTPDKPVGTVHIALHDARDPAGHTRHVQLALRGNRTTIQRAAALWALKLVWDRQRERQALGPG
jgi:nicotinamide-nucleotide amidase